MNSIHIKFKKTDIWNHSLNVLIVDPRYSEALWHELGHCIWQHGDVIFDALAKRVKNYHVSEEWLG